MVTRLALVLVICTCLLAATALAGRRRAWPKEMDDNPPVEKRTTYTNPPDVVWVGEGDLHRLRMATDVLVVLVIQPFVCEKCVVGHEALLNARNQVLFEESGHVDRMLGSDPRQSITFAMLDADEEAPEFISVMPPDTNEENYRMKVPCLLVFKKYHQEVLKRSPILFSYTEANLQKNLGPWLIRLLGPDIMTIHDEQQLASRLVSKHSNRVTAVVWATNISKPIANLAMEHRFEIHWSHVADPKLREQLAPKYNPHNDDIVFYFYKGLPNREDVLLSASFLSDSIVEMEGRKLDDIRKPNTTTTTGGGEGEGAAGASVITAKGGWERPSRPSEREHRALTNLMEEYLSLRPGHEFDHIRKTTVIEDHVPAGCDEKTVRVSRIGDSVRVQIVGRVVGLGDAFAITQQETLTVGMHRPDYPDVLLREGLEGLCEGSRRRVGFQALHGYKRDMLPPGVRPDSRIVFEVELLSFEKRDSAGEGVEGRGGAPAGGNGAAVLGMMNGGGVDGVVAYPPDEL